MRPGSLPILSCVATGHGLAVGACSEIWRGDRSMVPCADQRGKSWDIVLNDY